MTTTSTGYRRALDAEPRPNAFLQVHPVADLFPMLPDDELKDLAADITERGLLQPIVLDTEGRILDGRNRYAACRLAGIEPEFTTYDGDDPDGYALSVNIARRHLNKGQIALAAVDAVFLKKTELTREDRQALARHYGVSPARIDYAAALRRYPDLREGVMGGRPINEAYEEAKERNASNRDEDTFKATLRKEAPELANLLVDQQISLEEARTALATHRLDVQRQKKVAEIDAIRDADGTPPPSFAERAEQGALTWQEAETLAQKWLRERNEAIDRDVVRLQRITTSWGSLRLILESPDHPYTVAVLESVGEADREALAQIIAEIDEWVRQQRNTENGGHHK